METLAVVSFFVAVVIIAVIIAGAGYFFFRSRSGEGIHVNQRILLRAYMYLGTLAGLIVLAVGVSGLVRASVGSALGYDFSYYPQYVSYPRPVQPALAPDGTPVPLIPSVEEQREARMEGLKRASQEGWLNGISYTVVGLIIWGVHVFGRRRLTYTTEVDTTLQRAYLLMVVLIFGVTMLVNLPQGLFESLRYYVLEPVDEFAQPDPPGDNIAWALVALPIWVAYLFRLIRDVRREQGEA